MSERTLYPKIRTKLREIIYDLHFIEEFTSLSPPPTSLNITGTVKLHGTHADILIYPNNAIVFQSRNCTNLSTIADNHGFAAVMKNKTNVLLALRDRYYNRYRQLHPDTPIDDYAPLVLAGEWIGENIQKGVALTQLSKRFVIFSVHLNGAWVKDSLFGDISNEKESIFNIMRSGCYTATVDLTNPGSTEDELEKRAEEVAASCPFAKTFGVEGEGEGIVWKFDAFPQNPRVWFKTKGGKFKPNYTPTPRKLPPSDKALEQRNTARDCAKAWCSERRLEQGIEYLKETSTKGDRNGLGQFLKWIINDICVEEKWDIDELNVDVGMLKRGITDIAKTWYIQQMMLE